MCLSRALLVSLLILSLGGVALCGSPGGWFGPNYQHPPNGANTGIVTDGVTVLTWLNWWDANSQLWYYAYQVGNFNFQPHVGIFLMGLRPEVAASIVYEGHSYTMHPQLLLNWWNPFQRNVDTSLTWLGWAADPGHECSPNCGTSTNPYFEITSPFAPGPLSMKLLDLNYYELAAGLPDPMTVYSDVPGPSIVLEPGSMSVLGIGLLTLSRFFVRKR